MKRKILVTLLAFCLIASLCVVGAAAAGKPCDGVDCDHEAAIGDVHYDTLADALSAAVDGNTVMLLRDIDVDSEGSCITINRSITFDLGNKIITCSRSDQGIELYGNSNVTIQNGEIHCTNEAVALFAHNSNITTKDLVINAREAGGYGIQVGYNYGGDYPTTIGLPANLIMESGTVINAEVGVFIVGPYYNQNTLEGRDLVSTFTMNGGEINTSSFAICGNGTYDGTEIEINGGTVTSEAIVMYYPQFGDLIINGGYLTAPNGIQYCGVGTVTINGGTIVATADYSEFPEKPSDQNDGSTDDGAALSIISRGGGYQSNGLSMNVEINGGSLVSLNNAAINIYRLQQQPSNGPWVTNDSTSISSFLENLEITDGVIESAEGRGALEVDNLATDEVEISGGQYSASVAAYVAVGLEYEANSNGRFTYHRTIESAVEAAGSGGSVSMISDGTVVDETTGGHTITLIDGGSATTMTVTDGYVYTLPELDKNGYTFTGWRVNSSNTIVKGGESYPITANTTFTAVWNMIMIPDTYDIAVDQPAHGTVDVSFSNASQGSVITVTATPDEGYELVYITVDGEPISGNSFVMPDHAVEVSAVFAEIGKEVNFVDVSRADWFYDYVQYVAQNGLMEGTTRTAFEPNASMTRAMFWTVLARIDGETITGDAWKTLAQTWAVESGISDGTNADTLITREQMVTMLYRYAGSPVAGGMAVSEFTDGASVSDYATDAVTWALSEGILTGMGDGILAPQGTATRAQAAAMLMRFVEA